MRKILIGISILLLPILSMAEDQGNALTTEQALDIQEISKSEIDSKYVSGEHYFVHPRPYKTFTSDVFPKGILDNTVIEFFWIGCMHCQALHPILDKWKKESKDESVVFHEIPAMFSSTWQTHAVFYYAMKQLGFRDEYMTDMYDLFVSRAYEDKEKMNAWLAQRNIDPEELKGALLPESIQSLIKSDEKIFQHYIGEIRGVPFILVNGKYWINMIEVDKEEVPEIINFLLAK